MNIFNGKIQYDISGPFYGNYPEPVIGWNNLNTMYQCPGKTFDQGIGLGKTGYDGLWVEPGKALPHKHEVFGQVNSPLPTYKVHTYRM